MGESGLALDVEGLKDQVDHSEKEVQDFQLKVDNVSNLRRQMLNVGTEG